MRMRCDRPESGIWYAEAAASADAKKIRDMLGGTDRDTAHVTRGRARCC